MGQIAARIFQKEEKKQHSDKVFPFGANDKLTKICEKFYLEAKNLVEFHIIFSTMDKQGSGFISIEDLFEFLEEEMTSSLSPYIYRFFQLIEKEDPDKISFVEWLPSISVYCLYPSEKIISFVFNMIDDDHDTIISKKDLIKFLVMEKFGQKIFPFNYARAIELLDVPRSDSIDLKMFKRNQNTIPFLCYPAFRLQESLRQKILGETFWVNAYVKIKEKETEENKNQQLEKIQEELQKKKDQKIEQKSQKFDNLYKNTEIRQNLIKETLKQNIREPQRR